MFRVCAHVIAWLGIATLAAPAASAAALGPELASRLSTSGNQVSMGTVIVSFDTNSGLTLSHMTLLTVAGVGRGYLLPRLGMAAVPATAGQVRFLAAQPAVRSIWPNERIYFLDEQTRTLAGADRARDDPGFAALRGGLPVTGQGIGLLINDSGIDATHPDLQLGSRVVQNVLSPLDLTTVTGLALLPALEGVPNTDLNSGHGTHCAAIAGGSGTSSGGRYAGVAPGARLIGFGSGGGLFILNALGGFEYALANQARYNIRVISNSWGSPGPFLADDPVAIASKEAHDRGIVVVFAAGNSGPGYDTMVSDAKSPWVVSVAAGTKEGGLAAFSSRGLPKSGRAPGDYNAPTITAPGTGRELAANAGRFTSDVVSARALTNLVANGLTSGADLELAPADLPRYTQISGTSMAAPFVAGTVALMLSADPTLTPAEVKAILVQTASQMPGYGEFEAGAGYINVHAAVDKVLHRAKPYGSYGGPVDLQPFRLQMATGTLTEQPFHVDYDPLAPAGEGSANGLAFTVLPGASMLDVSAVADSALLTGDGNTVGMLLTDPAGRTYSSGLAIPIMDTPRRQIRIAGPAPGPWRLEIRGLRGLAALPELMVPVSGLALPGPVDGTITQSWTALPAIADLPADSSRTDIETALRRRFMDVRSDGRFHPGAAVTREELARILVVNAALRQSLADSPRFSDTPGDLGALAEAVTADGSTLRDYDFAPSGLLAAHMPVFQPNVQVSRLDLAVALVKALGLDAEALARAGGEVTVEAGGQTVPVSDAAGVPAELRGYLQLALDHGILRAALSSPPLTATVSPDGAPTRAELAAGLVAYRRAFDPGDRP